MDNSQGVGAASDDDSDVEVEFTVVVMEENWTFDECRQRPVLFRYLEVTQHVRFGDEQTSLATAKVIKPYGREVTAACCRSLCTTPTRLRGQGLRCARRPR